MITELHLQNFKCFEKQALPLRNLTVLAGLNGMGKSSVIQSLLLLRQSHEQNLLAASGITLNGDLVKIGTARDALYTGAAEEVIGFGLDFEDGTQAEWRLDAGASNDMLDLVSPEVGAGVFEQSLFTSDFHYVEAERLGPRTTFEVSDDQVRRRGQLGTRGEYTAHFLEVHGREPIGVPARRFELLRLAQIVGDDHQPALFGTTARHRRGLHQHRYGLSLLRDDPSLTPERFATAVTQLTQKYTVEVIQ